MSAMSITRVKSIAMLAAVAAAASASADEGGNSFWLPGSFGSMAAAPSDPGWLVETVYYHAVTDAGAGRSFVIGGNVVAGLHSVYNLVFLSGTYTFKEPVLGAQPGLGLAWTFGGNTTRADVMLTDRAGNTISVHRSDSVFGGGDLSPAGTLKWTRGVSNFMLYASANIPVGAYDTSRLANLGLHHASIDGGGGYTWLDDKGREVSVVAGLTHNWTNSATSYRSGLDGHVDWALAKHFGESASIALAGYGYFEISGDSGAGARLGSFKSRVVGIGPQGSHDLALGTRKVTLTAKVYREMDNAHRADGWNAWLVLDVPFGGT
jgi:hypothetical protein